MVRGNNSKILSTIWQFLLAYAKISKSALIIFAFLSLFQCQNEPKITLKLADEALLKYDSDDKPVTEKLSHLDSLEPVFKSNDTAMANLLRRKGICYMHLGQLDEAIKAEMLSLEISEKQNNFDAYWSTYSNFGTIYQYFELNSKALEFYRTAYKYYDSTDFHIPAASVAYNISTIYGQINLLKAKEFSQYALQHKRKIPAEYDFYKSDSLSFYLQDYLFNKDSVDLLFQLYSMLKLEQDILVKTEASAVCMNEFLKTDLVKSNNCRDTLYKYLYQIHDIDSKKMIFTELLNYYKSQKVTDSFYHYTIKYKELTDSSYSENSLRVVSNTTELFKKLTNQENRLLTAQNSRKTWIANSLIAGMVLLGVIGIFLYRNFKHRQLLAKQEIALKAQQLTELLEQQENVRNDAAIAAVEKERFRIAKELHDKVGGILGVAKLNFSSLQSEMENLRKRSLEQYLQVESCIEEAIAEVRKISHDFKVAAISYFDLVESLSQLKQTIETANVVKVNLNHPPLPPIPYSIGIQIYRTCRELVNNTLKHANAANIMVQINYDPDANQLHFSYEDDGKGFVVPALNNDTEGMGIANFYKTAQELHGTCQLESFPGKGMYFMLEVSLPGNTNLTDMA